MIKSIKLSFLMGQSAANKSFILRRVSCTDSEMDRAEMLAALDNSQFQYKKVFDSGFAERYDANNVCLNSKEDCEAPNGNLQNNSGHIMGGHVRAHGSFQSDANLWNCSVDDDVADTKLQVSSSGGQSDGSSSYQGNRSLSSFHQLSKCGKFLSTTCREKIDSERSDAIRMETEDEASGHCLEMNNSETEGGVAADGFVHAASNHDHNIFENDELFVKNKRLPPLYTLRRDPKPSKRLVEVVASASASDSKKILSMRDGDIHACTECGKEFGSWKGLFGHMRCHPEREWRGIQRRISVQPNLEEKEINANAQTTAGCVIKRKLPLFADSDVQRKQSAASDQKFASSVAQSLSDTESESDSIEATYLKGKSECYNLQRWKITRKRSKRSRQMVRSLQAVTKEAAELDGKNNHNISTDHHVKEERNMADCLVMLASCGEPSQRQQLTHAKKSIKNSRVNLSDGSFDVKRRIAEESARASDGIRFNKWTKYQKDKSSSNSRPEIKTKRMFLNELDIMEREENDVHEGDEPDAHIDQELANVMKYECTRCKKAFKSHQALGGHRASHKKVKGCCARAHSGMKAHQSLEDELPDEHLHSPRSLDEENYAKHPEEDKSLHVRSIKPTMRQMKKTNAHECSICHLVFASGQALGGHKRRHWSAVGSSEPHHNPIIKQQLEALSSLQQTFQSKKTREEIDLNLPAPLEDAEMTLCLETASINNENSKRM